MITTGDFPLLRTTVNDTSNLVMLMMMNTIGLSIIYQELRYASWAYFNPKHHPRTASDSLAFIQGTGLDIVIDTYHLMYDADRLRNVFFSMVGDHEKISYLNPKRVNEHKEVKIDDENK